MSPFIIFIGIVSLLVLIYLIYKLLKYLDEGIVRVEEFIVKANQPQGLSMMDDEGKDLITFSQPNQGFSFSTLIWFYIKDYNYRYGMRKVIMRKGGFIISLMEYSNSLEIAIPIYDSSTSVKLKYENLPLQKWICLVVLLENRHIDLWMNGELYQSKHLENFPKIFENKVTTFVPGGGFSGFLGTILHFEYPLPKSTIISYFKLGPIENSLLSIIRRFFMNTLGLEALFNVKIGLSVNIKAGTGGGGAN